MKGGFNKILRNVVAGSSDTEFEKVGFPHYPVLTLTAETLQSYILARLERAKGETRDL